MQTDYAPYDENQPDTGVHSKVNLHKIDETMTIADSLKLPTVEHKILLNIPSEATLQPMEVQTGTSPFERGLNKKFQIRSPSMATQAEIDLTKRYMYANEQLKQTKIISKSIIQGRKYTLTEAKKPLSSIQATANTSEEFKLLAKELNLSQTSIKEAEIIHHTDSDQRSQIQIKLKQRVGEDK